MDAQQPTTGLAQEQSDGSAALKRRGLMAGAAALVAGFAARRASQPVEAGIDGDLVLNTTTLIVGTTGVVTDNSFNAINAPFGAFRADASQTTTVSMDGLIGNCTPGGLAKGVHGKAFNGYGVYGEGSTDGWGVAGIATNAYGVVGQSMSGTGIQGQIPSTSAAANTNAIIGTNQSSGAGGNGVYGTSAKGYGVLGYSTGGSASLSGISTNANIPAFAGGNAVPGGLAASFSGTVYVNGMFVVADMTQKHGLLKHPDGSHRLMYTVEAPESWAEDFGTGTLVGGKADVKLDTDFAALIHTDTYHVFITGHDPSGEGLVVSARHADGFVVEERKGGKGSGTFSWRVVAKPKSDTKVERLGKFVAPNVPLPDVSKLPRAAEQAKKP